MKGGSVESVLAWRATQPAGSSPHLSDRVVSTDELISYGLLTGDGYKHGTVKHGQKEYAYFDYRTGEQHHTHTDRRGSITLASARSIST